MMIGSRIFVYNFKYDKTSRQKIWLFVNAADTIVYDKLVGE